MDKKKLSKLRKQLRNLRRRVSNLKARDLERFLKVLGRKFHKRGKEATYISLLLPDARPITIPHHSTINRNTANNILDQCEEDIFRLDELLGEQGGTGHGQRQAGRKLLEGAIRKDSGSG